MPKLNPNRPIVERYFRVPIRELFWNSSGIIGQTTEHRIGPVCLKIWTLADDNGVIEWANGGRRWPVQYHPRSQWRWNDAEYCADYWVIGSNGKRHRYLLVAPDGSHVATRTELSSHYHCSHIKSTKRRIRRRREILAELLLNNPPENLDLKYIELRNKPKGMGWNIWTQREQARLGHDFVLVRRVAGMSQDRFQKLLRKLNRVHRKGGVAPVLLM
jgi:hypothetical protein